MSTTNVSNLSITDFGALVTKGYPALFGQAGEVVDYSLSDGQNHVLYAGKGAGSYADAVAGVVKAFQNWFTDEKEGVALLLQANVMQASGVHAMSGFVSLSEGVSFIFPEK